jgi:uncharacterized protein YbjT (DUF2867 family)
MILVTGATGFIGPKVVHALRARGLPVRALVRDRAKGRQLEAWGAELAEGDVTRPNTLWTAAERCEAVVHLVSIRTGRRRDFEAISQGAHDLLEAAHALGVGRFVHMSASGVGEATKDLTPYYRAKWEMEQAVKGSAIDHVIFRPSFVFARDGGILPTFRRIAKIAPVTPITGSGRQRIQPIWIDNVVEYFARSLTVATTNRTFELGGPDVVTWNELWQRLKSTLGLRRPSIHVPIGILRAQAVVVERLPGDIPLTRDLLKMLEHGDNVVSNDDAVREFTIPLVPLGDQLRRAAS